MNKRNNQRATYGESTMMEHTLYHAPSLYVALRWGYVSFMRAYCLYASTFFVTSDTKNGCKRPWCAT